MVVPFHPRSENGIARMSVAVNAEIGCDFVSSILTGKLTRDPRQIGAWGVLNLSSPPREDDIGGGGAASDRTAARRSWLSPMLNRSC